MKKQKTIICVVGPSGSGKTTAVEFASKALGIPVLRSYTTRPMRDGEVNGVDHIFVTEADMPKRKDMLAYTYFGGHHYWGQTSQVDEVENAILYVIDEVGVEYLQEMFGQKYIVNTIYISPSKEVLDKVDPNRRNRDNERLTLSLGRFDAVVHNDFTLEAFLVHFTNVVEKMLWQQN